MVHPVGIEPTPDGSVALSHEVMSIIQGIASAYAGLEALHQALGVFSFNVHSTASYSSTIRRSTPASYGKHQQRRRQSIGAALRSPHGINEALNRDDPIAHGFIQLNRKLVLKRQQDFDLVQAVSTKALQAVG